MSALTIIAPIVLLLLLGQVFRQCQFLNAQFFQQADKLNYYIMLPAMLVSKMFALQIQAVAWETLALFILSYLSLASGIAWLLFYWVGKKKSEFSSIFQSHLRFNNYLYFSLVAAFLSNEQTALAILISGLYVPLVNVLSVSAFFLYPEQPIKKRLILGTVIKNPLIIAIGLGFALNQLPWLFPQVLQDTLRFLSLPALPLALLSIGASLSLNHLRGQTNTAALLLSSISKLWLLPLLALLLGHVLKLDSALIQIVFLLSMMPTSTASFVLAKQLGGDEQLMANLISLQTLLSILSITLWLALSPMIFAI